MYNNPFSNPIEVKCHSLLDNRWAKRVNGLRDTELLWRVKEAVVGEFSQVIISPRVFLNLIEDTLISFIWWVSQWSYNNEIQNHKGPGCPPPPRS